MMVRDQGSEGEDCVAVHCGHELSLEFSAE